MSKDFKLNNHLAPRVQDALEFQLFGDGDFNGGWKEDFDLFCEDEPEGSVMPCMLLPMLQTIEALVGVYNFYRATNTDERIWKANEKRVIAFFREIDKQFDLIHQANLALPNSLINL